MSRVIFPIERGPIQCPNCKKYLTPINLLIVQQTQQSKKIQCSYCGYVWEITQDRPDFYTYI